VTRVTVVDYGRGNLFSLEQALRHVGADVHITSRPDELRAADRVILPGVGAFGDAGAALRARGLDGPLVEVAREGRPLLGICVGCQLLLDEGEEFGRHPGLGLVPGVVRRLPEGAVRIPNVGWRRLEPAAGSAFTGMVYFVHSYAPYARDEADVAATIALNGQRVPAALRRGSIVGVQFHPEKSGPVGLSLLARFIAGELGSGA
jgi:imidazole glycerol-phosphate synthase subunit HisH